MEIKIIEMNIPDDSNIILGQSHFIKTVEDVYEAIVSSTQKVEFGIAFCEASGKCLVRFDGNNDDLKKIAAENALALSCGHCFIIILKEAYPINILTQLKMVPEVCRIFAATANPLQVIVIETDQGRGILGVVDCLKSKGLEKEEDVKWRKTILRQIGYKT
jgi:adenosine/AMP kinase